MPRITNDLHNALVVISNHGECPGCEFVIHKLELMGLIMYDFGGKWAITEEGKNYLAEASSMELNLSFRL